MRPLLVVVLLAAPGGFGFSAEDGDRLIRKSEPLSPEAERAALHVPEGFEVQLFAAEPQINKPINLAFDAKGRLWVSSTVEYPYAADKKRWSDDQGTRVQDSRDAIKILEDTDGDGLADKVTVFADALNIPTGVLPWHKPEHKAGCIAFSIPNIWYFADTDGDDRADLREVLFGPLGYEKDTHGMCSSFRLGLDGWVYATHGFNNTSRFEVRADRWRDDGKMTNERIPNDERSPNAPNPKSSDSSFEPRHSFVIPHSSFDIPGRRLELQSGNVFRFRPDGSKVERYTSGQVNPFGLAWDRYGNLYSADCHSSPVYQLIRGACYPSFGKPHDGLGFAPVMCQHTHGSTGICGIVYLDGGVWGPEWDDHILLGNCVTSRVNHDHVTFTGSTPKANEKPDFITSDDPWFRPVDLQLGPDNALYIADFYNKIIGHYEVPLDHQGRDKTRGRIWRVVKRDALKPSKSDEVTDLALIRRFRALEAGPPLVSIPPELERSPFKHPEDSPRVELARVSALTNLIPDARLCWDALGQIYMIGHYHHHDPLLYHACLIGQRSLFVKTPDLIAHLPQNPSIPYLMPSSSFLQDISLVLVAVPDSKASAWLLKMDQALAQESASKLQRLTHIARHGDPALLSKAIALAKQASLQNSTTPLPQLPFLTALHDGLSERGTPPPPELLSWAQDLAKQLLDAASKKPVPAWTSTGNAKWSLQPRKLAEGGEVTVLQSMAKGGGDEESRTGTLTSKTFDAPAKLTLWLNGHRGFPTAKPHDKNLVRIVETQTGQILARAFPPRDDKPKRLEFDLSKHTGKRIRLEIIDGDDGKAYAWVGITRIEPAVLRVEDFNEDGQQKAALGKFAVLLRTTAPVSLRDKLTPYLPKPPKIEAPKPRPELDALIAARTAAFAKAKPDATKGALIFQTSCAVCHQIKGRGGLIGPQLDGIGTRGAERLIEDILDPNRNVDAHFHIRSLTLKDGSVLAGFLRAEAGQVLILADAAGQEHRIAKADIAKDTTTPVSLMPPTFAQTLDEHAFHDLLGYLLAEKAAE